MSRPLTSLRAHSGSTFQHSADLRNELEEAILAYTHGYADNLRQFFLQNDKAKTGQLSDILFRRALRSIGIHGPVELLNRAIEEATDLKSGLIDYEAFLGLFAFKGDIPPRLNEEHQPLFIADTWVITQSLTLRKARDLPRVQPQIRDSIMTNPSTLLMLKVILYLRRK